MPIPARPVSIDLDAATPTPLTAKSLEAQLASIGLRCEDTKPAKLERYIVDVKSEIPTGSIDTWAILEPARDGDEAYPGLATRMKEAANGNWQPSGTALGYATTLEYIQYKSHFDWLLENRPGFTGIVEDPPTYEKRFDTVDAVKNMFVKLGTTASAAVIEGLDRDSIEAVLSNAIAPLDNQNAKNYDVTNSRVVFLVKDYNPATKEAAAIGALTIDWHLVVKDYRKKSKDSPEHDTKLKVATRSVLYDSVEAMDADYLAARAHFKENSFRAIPPKDTKVEIFASRPPANQSTFQHSLPKKATADHLEAIVLYAPNLQNVGCIDNTASPTTTEYWKAVTSGFTFSTTQTFSAEASFEASAEVVKAGFKIGFSISFTEQWSTSSTETMKFSVPPGEKAFTYQGYVLASTLVYEAATGRFSYKDTGRFVTNILATSAVPLVDPTGDGVSARAAVAAGQDGRSTPELDLDAAMLPAQA